VRFSPESYAIADITTTYSAPHPRGEERRARQSPLRISPATSICDDDHIEPVVWQNTLPIMVTILVAVGVATVAALISNSNMTKRLDDIIKRLGRIETKLDDPATHCQTRRTDFHRASLVRPTSTRRATLTDASCDHLGLR
jgi:hypothetical protein